MINKNTVIAQMMNMLNINDDKEIIGYITSVIYDDKEVRFFSRWRRYGYYLFIFSFNWNIS